MSDAPTLRDAAHELAAALGWPGGISEPPAWPDLLREVARLRVAAKAPEAAPVAWPTAAEMAARIRWMNYSNAAELADGLLHWLQSRIDTPVAQQGAEPEDAPSLAGIISTVKAAHDESLDDRHGAARALLRDAIESLESLPAAPAQQPAAPTDAARDVLAERQRQVSVWDWTPEHDDEHDSGELAAAACSYALAAADKLHPLSQGDGDFSPENLPPAWPWDAQWFKPGEPRRMLVKAGALILAEIERLDRAPTQAPTTDTGEQQ